MGVSQLWVSRVLGNQTMGCNQPTSKVKQNKKQQKTQCDYMHLRFQGRIYICTEWQRKRCLYVDHRHKHLASKGVEVYGSSKNSVALGRLLNVLVA